MDTNVCDAPDSDYCDASGLYCKFRWSDSPDAECDDTEIKNAFVNELKDQCYNVKEIHEFLTSFGIDYNISDLFEKIAQ